MILLTNHRDLSYITLLMSDVIGGARSNVFNSIVLSLSTVEPSVYYLKTVAKSAILQGLLRYSSLRLLLKSSETFIVDN